MNKIVAIPALKDNYIWGIYSPARSQKSEIIVVDPGEANPVLAYLKQNNLGLDAVLITHHHWDHTAGLDKLKQYFPNLRIYGPKNDNIPLVTHPVEQDDEIYFEVLNLTFKVLEIPGHTLDHVAYFGYQSLFCGDTLFSCGCGKLFEGSPEQMFSSLEKIKNLPSDTLIYCGHEYTLANLAFAQVVDPDNPNLQKRLSISKEMRSYNKPTLPVSLEEELKTNPFLRCAEPAIIQAVQAHQNLLSTDPVNIFAALRTWKNNFAA